jgi:phosphoribosylaminoimidazole (AIR) synthetase
MGIGLALVVRPGDLKTAAAYLKRKKTKHYIIGKVINDPKRKILI